MYRYNLIQSTYLMHNIQNCAIDWNVKVCNTHYSTCLVQHSFFKVHLSSWSIPFLSSLPPAYGVRGKVMFWQASVLPSIHLSVHRGGGGVRVPPPGGVRVPPGGSGTPPGGSGYPPGGSGTPRGVQVPPGGSGTPPGGSGTPQGGSGYPPPGGSR